MLAYECSKQEKLLREEVNAFRDHPALLSWYISDEPVGQGVPPDSLEFAYSIIKELDPYHPVAIVFMAPKTAPMAMIEVMKTPRTRIRLVSNSDWSA